VRDALVRVGLAAFLIAAYVRSVLAPTLAGAPRRTASGEPPASPNSGGPTHARGRSGFSSRQLEEVMMRELDTVLEARSELDVLEVVGGWRLVAAEPSAFERARAAAPALLAAGTGTAAFQGRCAELLLGGVRLAAVLRA
jgi:hypothetical protein